MDNDNAQCSVQAGNSMLEGIRMTNMIKKVLTLRA
jgi:hypothetical protein